MSQLPDNGPTPKAGGSYSWRPVLMNFIGLAAGSLLVGASGVFGNDVYTPVAVVSIIMVLYNIFMILFMLVRKRFLQAAIFALCAFLVFIIGFSACAGACAVGSHG